MYLHSICRRSHRSGCFLLSNVIKCFWENICVYCIYCSWNCELTVSLHLQSAVSSVKFLSSVFFFVHPGSRSYPTSCFHGDSHHLRGLPGSLSGASQVQSQRDASGIHIWCHLSSLSEGRVFFNLHLTHKTAFLCCECGYEGGNDFETSAHMMKRQTSTPWSSVFFALWWGDI